MSLRPGPRLGQGGAQPVGPQVQAGKMVPGGGGVSGCEAAWPLRVPRTLPPQNPQSEVEGTNRALPDRVGEQASPARALQQPWLPKLGAAPPGTEDRQNVLPSVAEGTPEQKHGKWITSTKIVS